MTDPIEPVDHRQVVYDLLDDLLPALDAYEATLDPDYDESRTIRRQIKSLRPEAEALHTTLEPTE